MLYWLKEKHFDVCLLQETFLTNDITKKIQTEWEGSILFNCGTHHSRGTAILFRNKHKFINLHNSDDSRIQLINVEINSQIMTIMNVYAPNNITERKCFFTKMQKWIDRYALNENNIIIGGDFNYTESDLDRYNQSNTKDASSVTYKNLINTKNLNDAWRKIHPIKNNSPIKFG